MTNLKTQAQALTIGIDLGDRVCFAVALNDRRETVWRSKVATTPDGFARAFGEMAPATIFLEVGTHSRWIHALLEELGHSAVVIDASRVPWARKGIDKSDWKDALKLARYGVALPEELHVVHHRNDERHADFAVLKSRDRLVRARSMFASHIRGLVKSFGKRIPSCDAASLHNKAPEHLDDRTLPACEPLLQILKALHKEIQKLDKAISKLCDKYPETKRLRQVTGVGPITALAFVLAVGEPNRFRKSRSVGSYFGLRSGLQDSCSIQPQLSITKRGNEFVRRLLVQASCYILGPLCKKDSSLRRWGEAYQARGGKAAAKRARVAVARKLAVVLHSLWASGQDYEPLRGCEPLTQPA